MKAILENLNLAEKILLGILAVALTTAIAGQLVVATVKIASVL